MSWACMCSVANEVKTRKTGFSIEVVGSDGVLCNDEEI